MSFHSFSPFCALLLIKTKAGREKRSEKEAILRILGHFLFFYLSSSFLFFCFFVDLFPIIFCHFHSFSPFAALFLMRKKGHKDKRSKKEAFLGILAHFGTFQCIFSGQAPKLLSMPVQTYSLHVLTILAFCVPYFQLILHHFVQTKK